MKASGRGGPAEEREQREVVELVPKQELDRAQRQIERLEKQNERLKQEIERLRRELEAALRASKRQAAPHSRGALKPNPRPESQSRLRPTRLPPHPPARR